MGATTHSAAESPSPQSAPRLGHALADWAADFRPLIGAMSDLAASEARLAAVSLGLVLAAAIGLVVMMSAAWIGAIAALALWLFGAATVWLKTASLIAVLSLAGAVLAYLVIRHFSRYLGFPVTRELLFQRGPAVTAGADEGDREHDRPPTGVAS